MPNSQAQSYTYRGGQKIPLDTRDDQFIVRALPEEVENAGIARDAEQVSSASSRVTLPAADFDHTLQSARGIGHADPAYYLADSDEEFLVTDRILVTFHSVPSSDQFGDFLSTYGLLEIESYSDRDYLFQLTPHTGMSPVDLIVKLMEDEPSVEVADHDLNYRVETYQVPLPTDPSYINQWHLHTRSNNAQFDPRASTQCENAWEILGNLGSEDVVVGVTDDGCKLDHGDFDSADKFAGWGYFRGTRLIKREDIDAEPGQMYQSGSNHGTSCAGVIAGEVDGILTVGAAPGCRLLPVKWESSGPSLFISDSKLVAALDYMADKVDVMSNSWGVVPTSRWASFVTRRIAELAQTGGRRGRGIVFLWAAGNSNCPIQHSANQEVPYTSGWQGNTWVGVQTSRTFSNNLVGIPGVVHVAALASNAQRSHYSCYGTGIGICAPTNNIHLYRRLRVTGLGITTATGSGSGITAFFGGTSSATPLVAGIAALVISANPELTAMDVISVLKRTASKNLDFNGYPRTPPASFNQDTSWDVSPVVPFNNGTFQDIGLEDGTWSPWFGHGRVDAPDAVAEAIRLRGDGGGGNGGGGNGGGEQLEFQSEPQLAIPDNNAVGIRDTIAVATAGQLEDIQVSVDIEHTWIGDLRVALIGPDATTVVLHNRSGSSQDNIQQSYGISDVAGLATLKDKPIAGDWSLLVQDFASRDTGTLKSWGLAFQVKSGPLVVTDDESVTIPDDSPTGITRSLSIPTGRTIREIAVSVDITHTWVGDLRVILSPPNSTPIQLHNRSGGNADNIIRSWHSQDSAALQALRGSDAGGEWQLQVSDHARRDTGKLNSWQIEIVS